VYLSFSKPALRQRAKRYRAFNSFLLRTRHLASVYLLMLLCASCKDNYQDSNVSLKEVLDSLSFKQIQASRDFEDFSNFILQYPESRYLNMAVDRYFVLRDEYYDKFGVPEIDCFSDCANIYLDSKQTLVYEHQVIKKEDLHDSLFVFLINKENNANLPIQYEAKDSEGNIYRLSKGYIQLSFIQDSSASLHEVLGEINQSIESYKHYLITELHGQDAFDQNSYKEKQIDSLLNFRHKLLLFRFDKEFPVTQYDSLDILNAL